jgi:hypothetical protein
MRSNNTIVGVVFFFSASGHFSTTSWTGPIHQIQYLSLNLAEDLFSDPSDPNGAGSSEFITLPDPELSNLADIDNLIKEAQNGAHEKEKLAAFIIIDVRIAVVHHQGCHLNNRIT